MRLSYRNETNNYFRLKSDKNKQIIVIVCESILASIPTLVFIVEFIFTGRMYHNFTAC